MAYDREAGGDRRFEKLEVRSGDIVVAALTGVACCEGSDEGDTVSDGDAVPRGLIGDWSWFPSRLGEYGGGGEATGSACVSIRQRVNGYFSKYRTVRAPKSRSEAGESV